MKTHRQLLLSGAGAFFAASLTHAAPITWGAATNTASKAELVEGVVVTALNGGPASPTITNGGANGLTTYSFSASNYTTVAFTPTGGDAGDNPRNRTSTNMYTPVSISTTGDTGYDTLIASVTDPNGTPSGIKTGTLTLGGLNSGSKYQVQVFFNDQRHTSDHRVMIYGDGEATENTVSVAGGDPADQVQITHYGQHAIGTFTADGTTQALTMDSSTTSGFGNVHYNAILVVDVTAPLAFLSTSAGEEVTDPFTVDVNFTEDVTGLEDSDFALTNATASMVLPATGPASSYTVLITPTASGAVTVDLPADSATDNDGDSLGNLASNNLAFTYIPAGSEKPTVTLSTTASEPVFDLYTVDVVFSEDVTGLEDSDFDVVGGTASGVSPAGGPASVYTVTITPTAGGTVTVTLPVDTVLDADDNLPNEASNSLMTQYVVLSIPSVELFNPFTGPIVAGPYTVDIQFSEAVTGLLNSDFIVTNGTASAVDPASGPIDFYTVLITPTTLGLVSVVLPAGSVADDDGQGQVSTASNLLYANNLPAGTYTSGALDLSGRDLLGLGAGESNGLFPSPKTFGPTTDFSLDDIPWSDGGLSGSFDLSFMAAGSKLNIERGGKGAFGTVDLAAESALIAPGDSVTLDSLVVSDLKGDLADRVAQNINFVAVYLGNETANDGATINGLVADGAPLGDTNENMRNDIELATSALVLGTDTGNGYSINGIDITFETTLRAKFVGAAFDLSDDFVITFSNLDTSLTYELRRSPDIATPFTVVPGSSKSPATDTDTFTDMEPLADKAFYQLWLVP